jgi:AcrR family transcriptional regulator
MSVIQPLSSPPIRSRSSAATPRLTREDWLDAALAAVVEAGFDQARVLLLAERLGVTRGSFYWHFTDHAALIEALLARWQKLEQVARAQLRQSDTADPHADLEHLLEAALSHAGPNLENVRFELALRELGRRDATVASMLAEIDAERMDLFTHKFKRLTGDALRARELSALFYLAITGSYQALIRPQSSEEVKAYLLNVIKRHVIGQAAVKPHA